MIVYFLDVQNLHQYFFLRRLNDMLRNRFVSIRLKCDNIDTIDIDIQNLKKCEYMYYKLGVYEGKFFLCYLVEIYI